jgi:hypothetical protein
MASAASRHWRQDGRFDFPTTGRRAQPSAARQAENACDGASAHLARRGPVLRRERESSNARTSKSRNGVASWVVALQQIQIEHAEAARHPLTANTRAMTPVHSYLASPPSRAFESLL